MRRWQATADPRMAWPLLRRTFVAARSPIRPLARLRLGLRSWWSSNVEPYVEPSVSSYVPALRHRPTLPAILPTGSAADSSDPLSRNPVSLHHFPRSRVAAPDLERHPGGAVAHWPARTARARDRPVSNPREGPRRYSGDPLASDSLTIPRTYWRFCQLVGRPCQPQDTRLVYPQAQPGRSFHATGRDTLRAPSACRHTRPSPDSDAPHYPPVISVAALPPPGLHRLDTHPGRVYTAHHNDQYDETRARARPRPGHAGRLRGPLLHHGGRPARAGPRLEGPAGHPR